jgi:hypothetical protein
MRFSERAISAIARALLNDRRDLSTQFAYWKEQGYEGHARSINTELQANSDALKELADTIAPWLKQRPDWASIAVNEPLPIT